MDTIKLSETFSEVLTKVDYPEYVRNICKLFADNSISKKRVDETLSFYGINPTAAKNDFVNLIFEYIKIALQDDVLSGDESDNIQYLKQLFGIQSEDFLQYNKLGVEEVIRWQMHMIYKDDNVTNDESLFKVHLQAIFDLSYDQMNDYAKSEAVISMQKGANLNNLDIFFTNEEYSKLKK